jgi:hypothetical protein
MPSVLSAGAAGRPFPPCPPEWAWRPIPPPFTYGNGLPTTPAVAQATLRGRALWQSRAALRPSLSAACQGCAASASARPRPRLRGRGHSTKPLERRADNSASNHAQPESPQARPRGSERDGDANPVGKRRRVGRSGRPGGHGGIRIPVALAQRKQLSKGNSDSNSNSNSNSPSRRRNTPHHSQAVRLRPSRHHHRRFGHPLQHHPLARP